MEDRWGFDFRKVVHSAELEAIYRLRYKVYVEEWGFERAEDHPGLLETDEFDARSLHFTASRYGQLLGTIRLIRHSELGFPLERHCLLTADMSSLDRTKVAEISRLAISKEYRRRAVDRFLYQPAPPCSQDEAAAEESPSSRRKRQEIIIGLFKEMYAESKSLGLTHWYAVMARALNSLLTRIGFIFTPIGPEVNYHGCRVPYILCIEEVERSLSATDPELYREFVEAATRDVRTSLPEATEKASAP